MIEVRLPMAAERRNDPEAAPAAPKREGVFKGVFCWSKKKKQCSSSSATCSWARARMWLPPLESEDVKIRLLSEPFDAIIMSGRMPSDWNAKEAYAWLKQNCPGMENHLLFTFSHGGEQGDERTFLQENNMPTW